MLGLGHFYGSATMLNKKINRSRDLRCFAGELICSNIPVTQARRDVDIELEPSGKFMNFLRTLAIVTATLFPMAAFADGNQLLDRCQAAEHFLNTKQSQDEASAAYCFGLMEGVRNTMIALNGFLEPKAKVVCWPSNGIDNAQAARITLKYLRENPNKLHVESVILTMLSFKAAFPCN
jgi:hypothetical protein